MTRNTAKVNKTKREKRIVHMTLIGLFIMVASMLVATTAYDCQVARKQIRDIIPSALAEAVHANAHKKTVGIPFVGYTKQAEEMGTYEKRVFQSADTTFTYPCKIVDADTHRQRSKQNFLLVQEMLHSSDVQSIFDSLLHKRNIYATTAIGITASYYKKLNEWSKDTTKMKIRLRASHLEQGLFEDINYYAYTDYSCATLWRLMPHRGIVSLAIILLLIGILFATYQIIERRKHYEEIKNRPSLMNAQVCEKTKIILFNGKEIKFTRQMIKLLTIFIEGEGKVKKTELQETLWPDAADPRSCMTSAISQLKQKLAEENFTDTIRSDPEDHEFYQLAPLSSTKPHV